ncbi:UPF0450 protein C17orf58 homolog isoform X2 [Passer montanus]|uniref:UPF0450 protein C17orf58 homolog isoform X2 n=1 Tax=Passer montanus TaxID=9160 RepID=UPI001960D47E|nr:UPF0450 protein C17orf58 homolog isoform X2 [Passer montanus]
MTARVFWLLCFVIRSSSGSVLYAEKPGQALSKDVFGAARGKAAARGPAMAPAPPQQPRPPGLPALASDTKKRAEPSLENSTGQRKHLGQLRAAGSPAPGAPPGPPDPGRANRPQTGRGRAGAANSAGSLRARPGTVPLLRTQPSPDPGESNRAGKGMPSGEPQPSSGIPEPSWVTNRGAPGYRAALGEDGDRQKVCPSECRKERDEGEALCASEFAVNGIVYNLEKLGDGVQWITLLVDSAGLYKMSRLYVTPDAAFFRAHILVVDTWNCTKPCPDFKLANHHFRASGAQGAPCPGRFHRHNFPSVPSAADRRCGLGVCRCRQQVHRDGAHPPQAPPGARPAAAGAARAAAPGGRLAGQRQRLRQEIHQEKRSQGEGGALQVCLRLRGSVRDGSSGTRPRSAPGMAALPPGAAASVLQPALGASSRHPRQPQRRSHSREC